MGSGKGFGRRQRNASNGWSAADRPRLGNAIDLCRRRASTNKFCAAECGYDFFASLCCLPVREVTEG